MSDLPPSIEIEGYRINEVLGRGGMGVVYKAEEIALSRPVALKHLKPQLADDESFLRRFRSEARALAQLNSPHIVQIFSLTETEIGLTIVMEYVEGRTLKQWITAGETNWKDSLPLMQQMLTALRHAHETGVIHRDIKPQNILLSDTVLDHGIWVKVTDFGLAKVNTSGDPSRTLTQGVYGTLPYMSPEQVEGHGEVDHRSDIYSLGMTCYEMLSGRLPFDEEDSEYAVMRTIVEDDLPELGTFAAGVPRELRDIVMKALAKDPSERFQSATQMQSALGELEKSSEQEYPVQESDTIPADPPPPEGDLLKRNVMTREQEETERSPLASIRPLLSSWSWRVAGAVVVFAVLLVGSWYFAVGSSPPWTGPKQDATAEVEEGGAEGDASERSNRREPSTDQQEPSAELSEGNVSGGQSGQSTEDPATEGEPGVQAADSETAVEEPPGAEAADSEAAGQEASNTGETQAEIRQGDLPPPIAPLLDVTDPKVLSKQIDERVERGQLTRGDERGDFFSPAHCYIFVVEGGRVRAVLGPRTDGGRTNLRTGEEAEDWSTRYSDSFQIWVDPISS